MSDYPSKKHSFLGEFSDILIEACMYVFQFAKKGFFLIVSVLLILQEVFWTEMQHKKRLQFSRKGNKSPLNTIVCSKGGFRDIF